MSKQQVQARTRSTSKRIANIRAYQRSKELEHKIDPPKIHELVLKQKQRLNPQVTPFKVLRFPCNSWAANCSGVEVGSGIQLLYLQGNSTCKNAATCRFAS
jgi:hypothetical protein